MVYRPRIRPVQPVQLPSEPGSEIPRFLLKDSAELALNQVVITLPGLYLIELADGTRSTSEISLRMAELTGLSVEEAQIDSLFEKLDENFLVDNDRARKRLAEISPRPARHAGGGYPDRAEALEPFLDELLSGENSEESAFVRASILPHIDFYRGRESYRAGYSKLSGLPQNGAETLTVVILGISHAFCQTPFILTQKDFETPLGLVETDLDLVNYLAQDLPFDAFQDEYNHLAEHSVEFHAVLLKRLTAGKRPLKIVPILCRSFHEAIVGKFSPLELPGVSEFVEKLVHLRDSRDDLHFLASVDLAHLGLNFGGPRLSPEFLAQLEERDLESLKAVELGQAEEFFATHQADGGNRNYCGTPAIYTLLHLFPQAFDLHHYEQCTDPDLGSTVTICSATLRESRKEAIARERRQS